MTDGDGLLAHFGLNLLGLLLKFESNALQRDYKLLSWVGVEEDLNLGHLTSVREGNRNVRPPTEWHLV